MFGWLVFFVAAFAAFLAYELWQLAHHRATLSRAVWRTQARYPILAFSVGALFGGLGVHFFGWLPACNP